MPFDFVNSTLTTAAGSPLQVTGQAIASGSGALLPSRTYTGITGVLSFVPQNNLPSGSFTSSLAATGSRNVYIVNGLVVSGSQ